MTLQVALVGTDGIILGSDRKSNTTPLGGMTRGSLVSKIFYSESRMLMACWSGSNASLELAKQVIYLPDDEIQNPASLESLGSRIFAEESEKLGVNHDNGVVILVMTRALDRIYCVQVERKSFCYPVFDKIIAGSTAVPSVYFTERLYKKLPIERLAPLVAHTIRDAGRMNQSGIEGLEMAYCSKTGILKLPQDKISELEMMSDQLEFKIRNHLLPEPDS
jgi:20S proteasome alpha/beta subunit